jgi:hypothetical protein
MRYCVGVRRVHDEMDRVVFCVPDTVQHPSDAVLQQLGA